MKTESLMGSSWQWDESPLLWMNCQLYQLLTMLTTHWFYWRQVQHSVTRCTLQTSHSSYFDECIGLICSTWIYGIHLMSTWIAVTSYLIYFNQVSLYSNDFHFSGTILFYYKSLKVLRPKKNPTKQHNTNNERKCGVVYFSVVHNFPKHTSKSNN